MPRLCTICRKKSIKVTKLIKLRGKFNPTIKRTKKPNIQWVTLPGARKRILACAKCIKKLAKT